MLLREYLRRAVDGDGVAEPDVDAALGRGLPDVVRAVLQVRRPALDAVGRAARRQYAADAAALRVLQKHQHAPLAAINDRVHAAREKVEYLLDVGLGEKDALLGARGAGGVEGHRLFHIPLRGAHQAVAGAGEVAGEGKGQLRYVREAVQVVLGDAGGLKEPLIEGALRAHAMHGALELEEAVLVKQRVVHHGKIAAPGLRPELAVALYPHPAEPVKPFL